MVFFTDKSISTGVKLLNLFVNRAEAFTPKRGFIGFVGYNPLSGINN